MKWIIVGYLLTDGINDILQTGKPRQTYGNGVAAIATVITGLMILVVVRL